MKDKKDKQKEPEVHEDIENLVEDSIQVNESDLEDGGFMNTATKDEPDLKAAQEFVGGYVEGIPFPNGDYLIINEEGKLRNLPLNPEATALWKATFDNDNFITGRNDFVVGPAILIKKSAQKTWAS